MPLKFSCTPVNEAISTEQVFQPHLSSAGVCDTDTLVSEVAGKIKDNVAYVRGFLSMLADAIKKHLQAGERVTVEGLCRFEPTATGSMAAEDASWDPAKNKITVSCIPYDEVKSAAADVACENVLKPVTVQLNGAQDATTYAQNEVVKGHTLLCQGLGMNCRYQENEDEGLFVVNPETGDAKKLTISNSTKVTMDATVPEDVDAGTYRLELRSRAGNGKNRTLVVAAIETFVIKAAA